MSTIRIRSLIVPETQAVMFVIDGTPCVICYGQPHSFAAEMIRQFLELDNLHAQTPRLEKALSALFSFDAEEMERVQAELLRNNEYYILAEDMGHAQIVDTVVFVYTYGDEQAKDAVIEYLAYYGLA